MKDILFPVFLIGGTRALQVITRNVELDSEFDERNQFIIGCKINIIKQVLGFVQQ